jgi:aminopeptidase N
MPHRSTTSYGLRIILCTLALTLVVGCLPTAAVPPPIPQPLNLVTVDPNATATPTPFQPAAYSPVPTYTATLPFTATPTLTATSVPPTITNTPAAARPTDPPALPAGNRTQYLFYVNFDYATRVLTADETIRYYNTTGATLSEIVMAVPPNLWTGAFTLNTIEQDGVALTSYSLGGERLSLSLPQPIAPGAATTLKLTFTLNIPAKTYEGTFGYLGYQVNLTDWYPFIVPYSNGWLLHDPWAFGEHLVYDASDFEINLKVSDPTIVIAASAPSDVNGEWMRYRIYGARTFVFTASDRYLVSESAVGVVKIRTYYFEGFEGAGEGMLQAAVQAVALFNAKFGPYPYDSLSVVQTEVPDGQEFDGLVFLASKFYAEYGGSAKSNLVSIGVHEIAHNWWFGLVGNDHALEPWLDESLATYSENTFYYYNFPSYIDWWWNFRVNYFGPGGWVDSSVYEHTTFRSYVNATYLNGANFLYDLNIRMGDDDFYRFLRDYTSRYSHGRATTADFFAVLRANTSTDVSDLIDAYFQGSY